MVWQKARILKKDISKLVKTLPPVEKYRLNDQLLRSSRSVCSQLAEGHGRRTYRDRLKYAIYSRGSLSETLNHLIDAFDEEYITQEVLADFRLQIDEVERLLNGYIRYLEAKIPPSS